MTPEKIIEIAVKAFSDKKGRDITVKKVAELTALTEYFIFVTATSSTHVRALAEEAEDKLSEAGIEPHHIEGRTSGWILLDYGSVVINTFTKNDREFYGLDRMWSEAEDIDISAIIGEGE